MGNIHTIFHPPSDFPQNCRAMDNCHQENLAALQQ